MVKSEIISRLASRVQQLSEKDIELVVNQIIESMSAALEKNIRIEIRGFGSFSLHYRPARNTHNPRTGKKVITTQKYAPHFKPGKEIRDRLNKARQNNVAILASE